MVRIRLKRTGSTHQPSYRIIVADSERSRDGKFLEILGSYNPRTEPFSFEIDEARAYDWMMNGAQPSESVAQLFKSVGLAERFARVKSGESKENVLKEAADFYGKREVSTRTTK